MEVVNRTEAPEYKRIEEVNIPAIATQTLDNGQPVYWINAGQQPVSRLEIVFEAGAWYEPLPGLSSLAMKMLTEGTRSHTSAQISEYFDRFGAYLEQQSGTNRASLTVYSLTKHLPSILPMVQEMLLESVIPEKELNHQKNISLQTLRVNLEKNNFVATRLIREKVFGKSHPYGHSQNPETLEAIGREQVETYYQQRIRQKPFRVVVSGQLTETEIALINQYLGCQTIEAPLAVNEANKTVLSDPRPVLVDKEDSLQSSIRLGRLLFTRSHPDYFPALVLNEVLGGYFGSRLMKNIREEKGFTYGIWSNIAMHPNEGSFLIGTDVKRENTQETLDEIWKEIRRLRDEPVPETELETVRNYMAGSYVGNLNTPFEIADRYKTVLFEGLPADYISTYIPRIRAVTAAQVQEMANRYLPDGSLIEVVVGGK
ncbi:M16 family metallopeptidase [Larkinella rosea]|uniref:Insulinase family protein n=1 Tax=Larkinella rosea TaxID=2025312 RepID=A0A3P1BDX4_9BACT|nr:pitrilysin family protein [Larkinella rosea]RRA98703.1 insulinase family protein [Larkinella rosea]